MSSVGTGYVVDGKRLQRPSRRRSARHAARDRRQCLAGADQSRRGGDRNTPLWRSLIIQVQGSLRFVHGFSPAPRLIGLFRVP